MNNVSWAEPSCTKFMHVHKSFLKIQSICIDFFRFFLTFVAWRCANSNRFACSCSCSCSHIHCNVSYRMYVIWSKFEILSAWMAPLVNSVYWITNGDGEANRKKKSKTARKIEKQWKTKLYGHAIQKKRTRV